MRREWLVCAVLAVTGCSTSTNEPAGTSSTSSASSAAVVSAGSVVSSASSTGLPGSGLTPGAGVEVAVSGGPLPASVTGPMVSRGGELAEVASWDARYETFGLPRVSGQGVRLVAAEIEATAVEGGWQRRDALQWLLMDVSHASLGAILDEMAAAADVAVWQVSEQVQTVGSGDCVERKYTSSSTSTVWKLSGCSYPELAGMFAVAVERSGLFTSAPSSVDPSVAAVVAAVGGELTAVSVFFGPPTTAGSATTLTVSATVSFTGGLAEAQATLEDGPLSGWRVSPGEGSLMYAGGVGARWVVSDGQAVFSAAGRLVS